MRLPWDVRAWERSIQADLRTNAPNLVVFTTFATFCQFINPVLWSFTPFLERLDRFLAAKLVISEDLYIATDATILGKVLIRSESGVWF
jgi:hypothetical protein